MPLAIDQRKILKTIYRDIHFGGEPLRADFSTPRVVINLIKYVYSQNCRPSPATVESLAFVQLMLDVQVETSEHTWERLLEEEKKISCIFF